MSATNFVDTISSINSSGNGMLWLFRICIYCIARVNLQGRHDSPQIVSAQGARFMVLYWPSCDEVLPPAHHRVRDKQMLHVGAVTSYPHLLDLQDKPPVLIHPHGDAPWNDTLIVAFCEMTLRVCDPSGPFIIACKQHMVCCIMPGPNLFVQAMAIESGHF